MHLLGCRYEDGRPEAAAEMRRERMTRTTLGQSMNQTCRQAFGEHDEDVALVMSAVGEAKAGHSGVLPHQHSQVEIEELFPAMPIIDLKDFNIGEDYVAEAQRFDVENLGDVIAEEIMERSRREGRRRHTDSMLCC